MASTSAVRASVLSFSLLALVLCGVVGCGVNSGSMVSATQTTRFQTFHGGVQGGQQPLVGSSIQLYAAGTPTTGGGYGQGSTALITGTLPVTDSNGFFTITGDYTAPAAASHFYIVATGGSPGPGNAVNPDMVLMSAIGGCTATNGLSSSLFVNINEVTTAAAVLTLQPYMAAPAAGNIGAPVIGAPSTDTNGLQNAFETAANLANIATGTVVLPANDWATTTGNGLLVNSMADILASCVNSDPTLAINCSMLFADATPTGTPYIAAETLHSGFYIAQNPTNNVQTLFNLIPPEPPFSGLSAAPISFTAPVATSGSACQSPVALATAGNFEVLAASTVSSSGATTISGGNLGLSPGTAVVGFPPGTVTSPGVMDVSDPTAAQAQLDLTTAYNAAAALQGAAVLPADISGLTLTPGLYMTVSTVDFSTNVTLDAQGDPNAVFIFQIGSSLTTGSDTQVVLLNGAQAQNVFWELGSAATLGGNSIFEGTIMAYSAVTLDSGVIFHGRVLVRTGAVTLDSSTIAP